MNKEELEKLCEGHFIYTEGIINCCITQQLDYEQMIGLNHYLYTQAMIHGYKHCKEEVISKLKEILMLYKTISSIDLLQEELEWSK